MAALDALIASVGTQVAAARKLGISQPYLSDIRNERRGFSPRILTALGFKNITVPNGGRE